MTIIAQFLSPDETIPLRAISSPFYYIAKRAIDRQNSFVDHYFSGIDWPEDIKNNPFIVRNLVKNILSILDNYSDLFEHLKNIACNRHVESHIAAHIAAEDIKFESMMRRGEKFANDLMCALEARNGIEKVVYKWRLNSEEQPSLHGTGVYYLVTALLASADKRVRAYEIINHPLDRLFTDAMGKFFIQADLSGVGNDSVSAHLESELLSFVHSQEINIIDLPTYVKIPRDEKVSNYWDIDKAIDYALKAAGPIHDNQFNNSPVIRLFDVFNFINGSSFTREQLNTLISSLMNQGNVKPVNCFLLTQIHTWPYFFYPDFSEESESYKYENIINILNALYKPGNSYNHEVRNFLRSWVDFHDIAVMPTNKKASERALSLENVLQNFPASTLSKNFSWVAAYIYDEACKETSRERKSEKARE